MQWHSSTDKLPTKLNAAEIKFDMGDLFMNGENHRGKTPLGYFKVTTPKNPLLSITSGYNYKESYQTLWPIPTYSWTFTLIPNWISIVVAIFPFNARIPVRD